MNPQCASNGQLEKLLPCPSGDTQPRGSDVASFESSWLCNQMSRALARQTCRSTMQSFAGSQGDQPGPRNQHPMSGFRPSDVMKLLTLAGRGWVHASRLAGGCHLKNS